MLSKVTSVLLALPVIVNSAAVLPRTGGVGQVTLPQFSVNPSGRAANLSVKRDGWQYGTPILGGSYSPNGTLGLARTVADVAIYQGDAAYISNAINIDLPAVEQAIAANGGLNTVSDYSTILYDGEFKDAIPGGPDPGILSNYTQDLQFSMERLSLNSYPLRRLKKNEPLPFTVDKAIVNKLTTCSLNDLQNQGRLFIVDHSDQVNLPKNPVYGAATTAYFFIHPKSGDFLPLAIKTNVGANLTYTPLDTPNDWLLAKIMFNGNDLFHASVYHLAASHFVGEIVHQAAERTLSEDHPIMALLDHLMVGAYAVRPVGAQVLFPPGGGFDGAFYVTGLGALQYGGELYPTVGAFQANYLHKDLKSRGLVDGWGPDFKNFPFYEDAKAIEKIIHDFMTSFVNSYYPNDNLVSGDYELQSFFKEANAAKIIDFPCSKADILHPCGDTQLLIKILTHFFYLNTLHHALNTGTLVTALGTLPFHPAALYAPLPTTKNISSIVPFLPPIPKALYQISLNGDFNRPQYAAQNRTLVHAFNDASFLSRFTSQVNAAAGTFKNQMVKLSNGIQGRTFDAHGLSQGMPFIYKCLDPGTIPYFYAV